MNNKQKAVLTAAAAACVAAPFGIEALRRQLDRRRYAPRGIFADVNGRRMHVYTEGQGPKTIVFLPGLGTPCPHIDFMPLIARLRGAFSCVVPEPFGYGYSDGTRAPRTAANIVAEVRAGLAAAGFKPPYVLLAHSISGIYALYWASHFPAEVEAVIGDDASVPAQADEPGLNRAPRCKWIYSLLNRSGVSRLMDRFPALGDRSRGMCGGDPRRLAEVRALVSRNHMGRAVVDELCRAADNCRRAQRLRYPEQCRVLHFVAQETIDSMPDGVELDWLSEHQKQALAARGGRCVLLPGGHFLHWTQADAMAREIRDFLAGPAPSADPKAAPIPSIVHRVIQPRKSPGGQE